VVGEATAATNVTLPTTGFQSAFAGGWLESMDGVAINAVTGETQSAFVREWWSNCMNLMNRKLALGFNPHLLVSNWKIVIVPKNYQTQKLEFFILL